MEMYQYRSWLGIGEHLESWRNKISFYSILHSLRNNDEVKVKGEIAKEEMKTIEEFNKFLER